MNIEAINVSLDAVQTTGVKKVEDTKTTLNNDSSFADTLGDATAARAKDKPTLVISDPSKVNDEAISEVDRLDNESLDKVKSLLSDQGFTESEISSIKNLKDLKKLLISKSKDGTLKTGEDLTNLLSMIGSLLGTKAQESFVDIKNLLDSVVPQIKTAATKFLSSGGSVDALKTFQDETDNVLSSNKQAIESLAPEDLKLFKAALTNEVNSATKNVESNPVNTANTQLLIKIKNEITSILDKYKSESSIIELNQQKPDVTLNVISNTQSLKGGNLTDENSSDDIILTKLVEPDNDTSKIDKATNFMTQFTNTTAEVKTVLPQNPVIDIKNVNTDIVDSLKFMQQGDIKNLTVTITPKELGTVVINLIMQNGTMMASITASNKEAYNLINSNLPDISAKLQNLNIAVQDLSLNIYSQDTTFFKGGSMWQDQQQQQQQNNQNAYKKPTGILDAPEEIMTQSSLNSNVNILA